MQEFIDPRLVEKVDRDGLNHVFSRIIGPSAFDNHFIGRILGLSIYEEYRNYNQALADKLGRYSGFITGTYDFVIAHTQNPDDTRKAVMKRTQKGGFSQYLSASNQAASNTLHAKLELCDIPRLFAVQFRGFSIAGSDLVQIVQGLPRNISPEDFRIHLRDFYIKEIQPEIKTT